MALTAGGLPTRLRSGTFWGKVCITFAAVGVFFVLRPDTLDQLHRFHRRHFTSKPLTESYFQKHPVRKLQIGAGPSNLPGWLNSDIEPAGEQIYLDATARFPFPSQSFQYIYSEHLIEHLEFPEGFAMLQECHRVLAPGGRVRIATPDLEKFIALFQTEKSQEQKDYIALKLDYHGLPRIHSPETLILNDEMRNFGHRFLYSRGQLRSCLEAAGFREVTEHRVRESPDAMLANLESRTDARFAPAKDFETMVFEAVR
jgi:predicted SAM-dependent methyltransferase